MEQKDRTFTIKLENNAINDGKVSLKVFTKTLESIQKVAYELAEERLNKEKTFGGRRTSRVERECELFVVKAEPGSLTASIAFPVKENNLAYGINDMADDVREDMKSIFHSIATANYEIFRNVIKDKFRAKSVYNTLKPILPSNKNDYRLFYKFDANEPLSRLARLSEDNEKIFVNTGNAEEQNDEAELGEESVEINARCKAIMREDGTPEIKEIIDYEVLDCRPYRVNHFIWCGEEFILKNEIACEVRTEEEYMIFEYPPLNIKVYGSNRDECIDSFNEEFSMLYHEYVCEKDECLTEDAIELKNKVHDLIEGVQLIEDGEN